MSTPDPTPQQNARTAVTVDNPDEHAAYCHLCETPLLVGDMCYECANPSHDQEDDDEGEMTVYERVEFCGMNIENGNIRDAINAMMFDGDVRVDSVKTAINLVAWMVEHQVRSPSLVAGALTRYINTWETR